MKVYSVLVHDRHCDPEIYNFRFEADAVSFARRILNECGRDPEEFEELEKLPDGWILFTTYSCKGDYVRVTVGELR